MDKLLNVISLLNYMYTYFITKCLELYKTITSIRNLHRTRMRDQKKSETKLYKRRKLRRLVEKDFNKFEKTITNNGYWKRFISGTIILSVALALVIGNKYTNFHTEFIKRYTKNLNQILYNKANYCEPTFHLESLIADSKENFLNQNEAFKELQEALRDPTPINAIAITGPSGVGKTYFANILKKNFQWPDNIHTYQWNTYVRRNCDKIKNIKSLIEKFSDCGRNLLIIDNLSANDYKLINTMNDILENSDEQTKRYAIILYIFNLNSMLSKKSYMKGYEKLQNLPNVKTINFKTFGKRELEDCIHREITELDLYMRAKDFNEIRKGIDVEKSGCKKVYAKVKLYADLYEI